MLVERRLQRGLTEGTVRLAFRRWKRPQVVAGRRYRSPIGMIVIDAITPVTAADISSDDARAAGFGSVVELLADLDSAAPSAADSTLYRLELHRDGAPDPRSVLAASTPVDAAEFEQLGHKLARLDANRGQPWTLATLRAIQTQPGTRAGDLAVQLGWSELADFKLHVRKLKALGMTLSLRTGYALSARGKAYLDR